MKLAAAGIAVMATLVVAGVYFTSRSSRPSVNTTTSEQKVAKTAVINQKSEIINPKPPPPAVAPFDAKQARAHQEAWAAHLKTTIETTNGVGMRLTLIPPGTFLMGGTEAELQTIITDTSSSFAAEYRSSYPQHPVTLSRPFTLGTTEVTVGQFRKFVEATTYETDAERSGRGGTIRIDGKDVAQPELNWRNPGYEQTEVCPVVQVSWNDAVAFCNWLSEQERLPKCYENHFTLGMIRVGDDGYRLPTEAEWEYACRAGTQSAFYWGNDFDRIKTFEWNMKNSEGRSHPVGTLQPNSFGLYDMQGNARAWIQDWYSGDYYAASPSIDPSGPASGSSRASRGGRFSEALHYSASAHRVHGTPTLSYYNRGFRVARTILPSSGSPQTSLAPLAPYSGREAGGEGAAGDVDLLAEVPDDFFNNFWRRDGAAVVADCPVGGVDHPLILPVVPSEEYDLELTVTQNGNAYLLDVGLMVGGAPCCFTINKRTGVGWLAGLSNVDHNGATIDANPTRASLDRFLPSGLPLTFKIEVRKARVRAFVAGEPLFDWPVEPKRLSLPRDVLAPPQGIMFVRGKAGPSSSGSWRIERAVLHPVSGTLKQVDFPPLWHDRRAAEWVLDNGGQVTIEHRDTPQLKPQTITDKSALPPTPFYLTEMTPAGAPNKSKFNDRELRHLLGLSRIKKVSLYQCSTVTNEGGCLLASIPSLREIGVGWTSISDPTVTALAQLPQLQLLSLTGTKVTDKGISTLREAPSLIELGIGGCTELTDACLADIVAIKNLSTLSLYQTRFTDEGLRLLEQARGLKFLNMEDIQDGSRQVYEFLRQALPECKIAWRIFRLKKNAREYSDKPRAVPGRVEVRDEATGASRTLDSATYDNGLLLIGLDFTGFADWTDDKLQSYLPDMVELETLVFDDTPLTDAAIDVLVTLPNLKRVSLRNTQVTPAGLDRLRKALPNCAVEP